MSDREKRDEWFVSQDPEHPDDIRICRQNPDSDEPECICCLALMGDTDERGEWTEETVREWRETAEQIVREHNDYRELVEALEEMCAHAVVLSRDYLTTFEDWPNNADIQGWEKTKWLRAADAKDRARAALAKAREGS